jgi:hypothetical protein
MTGQEQHNSLQYPIFLKENRCDTIKGRGCVNGRKQREHKPKEETSLPTVAIELLMLSCCIIDAKEGRDVATADIPGAFMQTCMKGTVRMVWGGLWPSYW